MEEGRRAFYFSRVFFERRVFQRIFFPPREKSSGIIEQFPFLAEMRCELINPSYVHIVILQRWNSYRFGFKSTRSIDRLNYIGNNLN